MASVRRRTPVSRQAQRGSPPPLHQQPPHWASNPVENIFAKAWMELDLERLGIPRWSGHSARVGASQDLAADGYNTLEIMQAGRWTSERMVIRYCRDILAGESAMARRRAGKG